MRSKFLCALLFFFIFAFASLLLPPGCSKRSYAGALIDKHKRLGSLPSPKIIFVGGSNLPFGLDSPRIEKELEMPVINMGLGSSLGMRYMLEEVKDHINNHDIVVLVPEYASLAMRLSSDDDLINAIAVYPQCVLYILRACLHSPQYTAHVIYKALSLPGKKWQMFFSAINKMCASKTFDLRIFYNNFPARYYFDPQGDYFLHLLYPKGKTNYVPFAEPVFTISDEAASLLNDFDKFARQRGARVVIIPPPLSEENLAISNIEAIANWPGKYLSIPVLANPQRYVFPVSDFYEQPYHLNISGRSKRTSLLIEDLKRNFKI